MGFGERFIGLVYGIISNNWYSVLVNGQPHGFFKSTRGVKQGDPLSTSLFILVAEALSRGLNALHMNLYFCGVGLPKWSPKINHLAYADDTIIFSSSDMLTQAQEDLRVSKIKIQFLESFLAPLKTTYEAPEAEKEELKAEIEQWEKDYEALEDKSSLDVKCI
uniref:Reverse transcriptase domain-containing protein n=1 Tax=Nicotiana tabacum TaxID=4097 RepID=A0A1S4C5L8_TOBAC|nr:PREDICTED: uncharacterized protein LOC107815343 [Nicotiana tabacum]